MKELIYLASPYFHDKEAIRVQRAYMVRHKVAELYQLGYVVYSPIAHNHMIAGLLPERIRHDHEFWMGVDLPFLDHCNALWVLTLDGWERSKGVNQEVNRAIETFKPIRYIAYDEVIASRGQNTSQQTETGIRPSEVAGTGGFD